jgi:phosphatidylglycerophosphate synthase
MPPVKKKYQDPIDNAIYKSAKYIAPTFKKLSFTANDITTLSNISMCITLILLLHAKYYWACLFVFLAYYFDCLDGFFARKYKQTSKFGEKYDHYSDIIKTLSLLIILFYINPHILNNYVL